MQKIGTTDQQRQVTIKYIFSSFPPRIILQIAQLKHLISKKTNKFALIAGKVACLT